MVDLILGTAQLGLAYGTTNIIGRPSDIEAISLLEIARSSGITTVDTADNYGDAEARLGELGYSTKFGIISKFQCSANEDLDVYPQLNRLKLTSIEGMLFHDASQISSAAGMRYLYQLRSLKDNGIVSKIGFSAYQIDQIDQALEYFPDPDIIQVPGNALDFRLLDSSTVRELASIGTEIHVRSVFLQGLLLAETSYLSGSQHSILTNTLEILKREATSGEQSLMQFLLNQIRNHPNVTSIVVGASSASELTEIVEAWNCPSVPSPRVAHDLSYEVLDPRRWVSR